MFGGSWCAAVAFGLTLLVVLAPPISVNGQGNDGERSQENTSSKPAPSQPVALPVLIVESEEEKNAREIREERAEQRELDDLAAQQGMNKATVQMADYAFYQTVLMVIGTVALGFTILLTRQQAKAADNAKKILRETSERQLRPILFFDGGTATFSKGIDGSAICHVTFALKNGGPTPAVVRNLRVQRFLHVRNEPAGATGIWRNVPSVIGPSRSIVIEGGIEAGQVFYLDGPAPPQPKTPASAKMIVGIRCEYGFPDGKPWDETIWLSASVSKLTEEPQTRDLHQSGDPSTPEHRYVLDFE